MSNSGDFYRRVVMAVPEAIWVVDAQGQTIFANRRMAQILGVDAESMATQSCFACLFPEDLADAQLHFARGLSGDYPPFDFRLRRADGSPIWVSISCMPMYDETGALDGLLGIFCDINERKQAEDALRESELRFRTMFNLAAVGVAQVSLTGILEVVNNRYCEILGYTREELLGRSLREISHPDDLAEVIANTRRLHAGDIPFFSMEKRYIRKNGAIIWSRLQKSLVRDSQGRPEHTIVVLEDITEARQAQAALRESEERFRNVADSAPVLIWYGDPNRQITFLNQQAATFSGRDLQELLGSGWLEHIHPDDLAHLDSTLAAAAAGQHSFQTEFRLRRHDGEYRWMLDTAVPRFVGDVYAGHTGIVVDITDLKRHQEQVLATQKLESLGVLASGIAHDFNNMLGGILAQSELAISALPASSQVAEEVNNIKSVAIRASEIVRQLLAYTGEEGTSFAAVDLSRLVVEMLQLLSVSISKRSVLKTDLAENLPAVRANAPQLRQIVMNLVTNASEAVKEEGGVITVTTTRVSRVPAPVAKSATDLSGGDYARLEVSDKGCGMSEEVQKRMFDPFFTTKFAGRGLGLAAVQGIVRAHGGTIEVESAQGQGTRIGILLPCTREPAGRDHDVGESQFANKDQANWGTVLFVEDEEMLRIPTSRMLRIEGFSVLEAADGLAAVELFRANKSCIGVVLLDLTLPGMRGKDVFEQVRRIRPDVKVVLTTAYSEKMATNAVGGQQDWVFIRKPYRLGELVKVLHDMLSS